MVEKDSKDYDIFRILIPCVEKKIISIIPLKIERVEQYLVETEEVSVDIFEESCLIMT